MAAPDPEGLRRALAPLRNATRKLQSARVLPDLAIVVYSTDLHLPSQITDAAFDMGAHALLTPPFTPVSVEAALQTAIHKHQESGPRQLPSLPPTPGSPSKSLPSIESSQDQLPTPVTARLATFTFEYPEPPVQPRRASVDNGALALTLADHSAGQGWAGSQSNGDLEFAQLILEMHAQTSAALEAPVPPPPTAHPSTRSRLIFAMSTWAFEPYKLLPDEVLLCASLIFENLLTLPNLPSQISTLTMSDHINPFLTQLRGLYRAANKYHSFIHATDVLQAIYIFLEKSGVMPPIARLLLRDQGEQLEPWKRKGGEKEGLLGLLSDSDIFLFCIAAIGHDTGHPGNSNAFLKNAQAPLSRLYEDKSALERMHCTLLLRLLHRHKMSFLIDSRTPFGREGRKIITGTILATDMNWHFEWLERFGRAVKERIEGKSSVVPLTKNEEGQGWVLGQATNPTTEVEVEALAPEEADREDRLFLCQGMMKCADISNPTRPHQISQHWSSVLLEEWATQALLERHLGLPVSVVADANEKVQAAGQVGFINLFVGPLFEAVSKGVPVLQDYLKLCMENKAIWEDRLAKYNAPQPTTSPTLPPTTLTISSPSSPPSSSTHSPLKFRRNQNQPQVLRPVPLVTPILPPMPKYSKTVFPLSLPSVTPPGARRLSKVSPWANTGGNTSNNNNATSSTSSSVAGGSRPTSPASPTTATTTTSRTTPSIRPFSPAISPTSTSATSITQHSLHGSVEKVTPPTVWENCKGLETDIETLRKAWNLRGIKVGGKGIDVGVDGVGGGENGWGRKRAETYAQGPPP